MAINWQKLSQKNGGSNYWDKIATSEGWVRPESVEPDVVELPKPENKLPSLTQEFGKQISSGTFLENVGKSIVGTPTLDETGKVVGVTPTMQETGDNKTFLQKIDWMPEAFNAISSSLSSAFWNQGQALSDLGKSLTEEDKSLSKIIGNVTKTIVSTAHLGFAPVSAAFGALEAVPVLGKPVELANEFLGIAGEFAGERVRKDWIDSNPLLSDEAKKNIGEPFSELTALAAQIFIMHKAGKITEKTFGDNLAGLREMKTKMEESVLDVARSKTSAEISKILTPDMLKKMATEKMKEARQEPRTVVEPQEVPTKKSPGSTTNLNEIIAGIEKRHSGTLISKEAVEKVMTEAQMAKRTRKAFEEAYAEMNPERIVKQDFISKLREKAAPWLVEEAPKVTEPTPAPKEAVTTIEKSEPIIEKIEPTKLIEEDVVKQKPQFELPQIKREPSKFEGEKITPQASEKLIERVQLNKEDFNLPETSKMDMAELTKKVVKRMAENPGESFDIATGKKAAPPGETARAHWKMWSDRATLKGDKNMVRELTENSPIAMETTQMGQEIKSLDVGEKTNAVRTIQEIQKIKKEVSSKKHGGDKKIREKHEKTLDESIKKESMKKQDWQSFIDSIVC